MTQFEYLFTSRIYFLLLLCSYIFFFSCWGSTCVFWKTAAYVTILCPTHHSANWTTAPSHGDFSPKTISFARLSNTKEQWKFPSWPYKDHTHEHDMEENAHTSCALVVVHGIMYSKRAVMNVAVMHWCSHTHVTTHTRNWHWHHLHVRCVSM